MNNNNNKKVFKGRYVKETDCNTPQIYLEMQHDPRHLLNIKLTSVSL